MTQVVLSSIDEALEYLLHAVEAQGAPLEIKFQGGLKTLEIEIEGNLFDGRLTGELARGLSELQDELYRAARFAITGKEGRDSRLTKSQKEAIELHIDVQKGCTLIKIDAGEFGNGLLKIIADSVASMTAGEIQALVISVVAILAAGWLGKHVMTEHFKAKSAGIGGLQETERLKIATGAQVGIVDKIAQIVARDERLSHFADATANGLTDIAVRATNALSVKIGIVELDEDELASMRKRAPKTTTDSIHETGDFRILHVDGSVNPFKFILGGASIPGEFFVEYDSADFTQAQDEKIWDAARNRKMIRLEVKAVQLRNKIKGAVLVDIDPPT